MLNMCAFIFTKSMVIGVKSCICTYFLHDLNNCEKCQIELIEKGELPFSFFGLLGCGNTQEKTAPQEIQAPIDTQTEVSQPSTVSKDAEKAPKSSADAKIY